MEYRFGGPARAARFAAALAVLASVFVLPAAPAPAAAMGALPACRYDDILTSPRQYTDWPITLVDTILRLPATYVPPDLVPVSDAGIAGTGKVRSVVIDDLRAMTEAAAAADAAIMVSSPYRSYEYQKVVFSGWVDELGRARALKVSARPGHSEHQLGVAVDFKSDPPDPTTLNTEWAKTAPGKWMRDHAWEYGWVMSYPKGKSDVVCYDWEPWHFRYVGRDLAAAVRASGLTLREYLWSHFTTTVVPGKVHTPTAPPPTPEPTPPAPTASLAPSEPPLTDTPFTPSPTTISTLPPSLVPTPAATGAPTSPLGAVEPGVGAGIVIALAAVTVLGWMVLRRRRTT